MAAIYGLPPTTASPGLRAPPLGIGTQSLYLPQDNTKPRWRMAAIFGLPPTTASPGIRAPPL